MNYDFSKLTQKADEVKEWLKREYAGIRTGRAAPALLDSVQVEVYGTKLPLPQTASVSVEDARSLIITPWDASLVKEIEKATTRADLGVSLAVNERGIRVLFPELTSERRSQLKKLAGDKHEQARVSLRAARDDTWNDIQKKEKAKDIGEDDKFRFKEEMEKIIQNAQDDLDALLEKKEQEIS